jgi:hypothetical protein
MESSKQERRRPATALAVEGRGGQRVGLLQDPGQPQARQACRSGLRLAFGVPAAHGVVLGQHLGQLVDQALGRAGLGRLGLQARRQVVVLGGEAGGLLNSRSMFQMRSPILASSPA